LARGIVGKSTFWISEEVKSEWDRVSGVSKGELRALGCHRQGKGNKSRRCVELMEYVIAVTNWGGGSEGSCYIERSAYEVES